MVRVRMMGVGGGGGAPAGVEEGRAVGGVEEGLEVERGGSEVVIREPKVEVVRNRSGVNPIDDVESRGLCKA